MISRVRRKILAGALLTAVNALPLSRALSATPRDYGRPPNVPSDDLLTRIWLGQHYLKIHPEECSASRISYVLFGDEYVNLRRLNNRPDLQQQVLQQHDRDFRQGDLVIIAGWVLTRTEARVFALSAIESAS